MNLKIGLNTILNPTNLPVTNKYLLTETYVFLQSYHILQKGISFFVYYERENILDDKKRMNYIMGDYQTVHQAPMKGEDIYV